MTAAADSGSSTALWVWGGVAAVVVALFMGWLALTSEPSVIAAVQEDSSGAMMPSATGVGVTADQLESGMASYVGQDIELANVPVAGKLGQQIIWIELPSRSPFPVKADPALIGGIGVQTRVTVVGRLMMKTDSVLNAWEQAGVLENAGHRAQAEYGMHYIEAVAVRAAGGL